MKAVIMCGGLGSRLKPMTESVPKPLVRIVGREVIDILIMKLISAGITDIYISLGYMSDEIIRFCESKNYSADIHYVTEEKPLGTAGGVKNCIVSSTDDILILSGDNIFDFDLQMFYDFYLRTDADICLCAVTVSDPREYGVVICDEDYSIRSFVEKPCWENAEGNLVNTGIYLLKGEILRLIPDNRFYDFSEDLFPEIFQNELRFMCYNAEGYWGDMGDISSYFRITRDILDRKYKENIITDILIEKDIANENGSIIKAPCVLSKYTSIAEKSIIGPYCVIGKNTSIERDCTLDSAIIGENCTVGENCDIKSSIVGDSTVVSDNCCCEKYSVLGYGSFIGRFSRILSGSRIWPGRRIESESVINGDMFYESPVSIRFDSFGLSGKINSQITVSDAARLGQSIASIKAISRLGVGFDGNTGAEIYKDLLKSGIRTCGKDCYDFDAMVKSQAYFYSAYCSLDAFIFVSVNGDVLNFSFFGKFGIPFSDRISRNINNNFKFSSFSFNNDDGYKECFNFRLFFSVYQSYLKKIISFNKTTAINIFIETENRIVKNILDEIFASDKSSKSDLQILINADCTDFYIIENEKVFSSDRISLLLIEYQMAEGKDVIVPEDAPCFAEELAEKYNVKLERLYSNNSKLYSPDREKLLNNIWFFDPIMMIGKILNIISNAEISLSKLFEYQRDFASRKAIIEFDGSPSQLRDVLSEFDLYDNDKVYRVFNKRNGKVRLRQLGNSSKIRLLVEAADMEIAKELSVSVTEKIKNANIDKNKQKL